MKSGTYRSTSKRSGGATENVGLEINGPSKSRGMKMQNVKFAGHKNADFTVT